MSDALNREQKRTRQACLNCRRKKTRCSGERPVCSFCARLNQHCTWDGVLPEFIESTTRHVPKPSRSMSRRETETSKANLAARVALLESRLALLGDNVFSNDFDVEIARELPVSAELNSESFTSDAFDFNLPEYSQAPQTTDLTKLPPRPILESLVETYFQHCHNQPYTYFHESTFRQRFREDLHPEYLLYAFAATACRFSDHDFYRERQSVAIEAYAEASWKQVFEHSFSHDEGLDYHMVQATSMLAVIDFTNGRPKLGWIKFALTTRFAQGLQLNQEPSDQLPAFEQEERRRTFWSVFLLDQLISLGPNRSPTFLDTDCHLRLPCSENDFRSGSTAWDTPTLEEFMEDSVRHNRQDLDHFATTIVMASTLGQLIRFSLKPAPSISSSSMPWSPKSKYQVAHSTLLQYESRSACTYDTFTNVVLQHFTTNGRLDQQRASHFTFSEALFHLNYCLLNHPFVLYHAFHRSTIPIPPSFVREALQRCYLHASDLLALLEDARAFGSLADASFYGYCAMSAGIIHALYQTDQDPHIKSRSCSNVQTALAFLEREPVKWRHSVHMKDLLRKFQPDAETRRVLTDPIALSRKANISDPTALWQLLDYGCLPNVSLEQTRTRNDADTSMMDSIVHLSNEGSTPRTQESRTNVLYFASQSVDPNLALEVLGEDMGGMWQRVLDGYDSDNAD